MDDRYSFCMLETVTKYIFFITILPGIVGSIVLLNFMALYGERNGRDMLKRAPNYPGINKAIFYSFIAIAVFLISGALMEFTQDGPEALQLFMAGTGILIIGYICRIFGKNKVRPLSGPVSAEMKKRNAQLQEDMRWRLVTGIVMSVIILIIFLLVRI